MIFVGPSIWRNIDVRTMSAMLVAMTSNPYGEPVMWAPLWNDALIGRSRSIMCTEFLKTEADVMVIIDDDIVFEPADFWKIVEGARETRGIYGGAYVTRSTEAHLTSRAWPNTPLAFYATPNRRPIEFQYLATGFFAIHRDVIESMIGATFKDADGGHRIDLCELGADRPFYPFFSPFQIVEDINGAGKRHYLSEDWAFCARWAQLGGKIWVDQSIILQHMGLYPYTVADIKDGMKGLPSTGIDRAEVSSEPAGSGDPLVDSLVEDIAEFAGENLGDARRLVEQGQNDSHRLFAEKPAGQTEAQWYQRDDVGLAYICDLANWHMRGAGVPREYAESLSGKTVLDYGCGIGTFALIAARAGAVVECYEPNPTMREFLAWRAEKHGLTVHVLDTPPEFGRFDVVVCWHVFEHVGDPEGLLDRLLDMVAPDGVFISDDGFDDQATPQHHYHPDWASVLSSRDLVSIQPQMYRLESVAVPA